MRKTKEIFEGEKILIRNEREKCFIGCFISNIRSIISWEKQDYYDDNGIALTYDRRHAIAVSIYKECEAQLSAMFFLSMLEEPCHHTFDEYIELEGRVF